MRHLISFDSHTSHLLKKNLLQSQQGYITLVMKPLKVSIGHSFLYFLVLMDY